MLSTEVLHPTSEDYPILQNPIAAFNIGEELARHRTTEEIAELQTLINGARFITLEDPEKGAKIGVTLFEPETLTGPDTLVPLPLRAYRSSHERLLEGAEIAAHRKGRVLMAEYPGFGDSTTSLYFMGAIAAGSANPQADSLHRAIANSEVSDFGKEHLTLFGESLGGALGLCYVAKHDVDELVLFESSNLFYPNFLQFSVLGGLAIDVKKGQDFRKDLRMPHVMEGLAFDEPVSTYNNPANTALMLSPGFGMGRGFKQLAKGLERNQKMKVRIISAADSIPFKSRRVYAKYIKLREKYGDRVSMAILPGEHHSTAPFNFRRVAELIGDTTAHH